MWLQDKFCVRILWTALAISGSINLPGVLLVKCRNKNKKSKNQYNGKRQRTCSVRCQNKSRTMPRTMFPTVVGSLPLPMLYSRSPGILFELYCLCFSTTVRTIVFVQTKFQTRRESDKSSRNNIPVQYALYFTMRFNRKLPKRGKKRKNSTFFGWTERKITLRGPVRWKKRNQDTRLRYWPQSKTSDARNRKNLG